MANKARKIGDAVKEGARNPRHNLELVGALLIGTEIADSEQIESVTALLDSIGIGGDIQIIGGLAIVLGARVMSWINARRQSEKGT